MAWSDAFKSGVKCPWGEVSSGLNVFWVKGPGVKCTGVKCPETKIFFGDQIWENCFWSKSKNQMTEAEGLYIFGMSVIEVNKDLLIKHPHDAEVDKNARQSLTTVYFYSCFALKHENDPFDDETIVLSHPKMRLPTQYQRLAAWSSQALFFGDDLFFLTWIFKFCLNLILFQVPTIRMFVV